MGELMLALLGGMLSPLAVNVLQQTYVWDKFTGTNGADINGRTPDTVGAGTWAVSALAAFDIQSNQANYKTAGTGYSNAIYDIGVANGVLTCDIVPVSVAARQGLATRYTDLNNHWRITVNTSTNLFEIVENNAGVVTSRASASVTITAGNTYTFQVTFNGGTITALLNGANSISYSSATLNQTATKFGIGSGSATLGIRWDNFKMTSA